MVWKYTRYHVSTRLSDQRSFSLTTTHLTVHPSVFTCLSAAVEVDDSQDSSIMTDADDTQLHTAESDDVL